MTYLEDNSSDEKEILCWSFCQSLKHGLTVLNIWLQTRHSVIKTTFNVNIRVVSFLGHGVSYLFQPVSGSPMTTIYLGHLVENHICLSPSEF